MTLHETFTIMFILEARENVYSTWALKQFSRDKNKFSDGPFLLDHFWNAIPAIFAQSESVKSVTTDECKLNQHHLASFLLQVYEEKEKMWERELRKIKGLYDNRLRASQQKSSKMEQALTNQTYQVTLNEDGIGKSIFFVQPQ